MDCFENDVSIQVLRSGRIRYRMRASAEAEVWCAWTWPTYFIYWQIHGWKTFSFLPRFFFFFFFLVLQLFCFSNCNSLCSVLFSFTTFYNEMHYTFHGNETCITSIFCTVPHTYIHSQQKYKQKKNYWLLNAPMNDYVEVKMTYQSFNVRSNTFVKTLIIQHDNEIAWHENQFMIHCVNFDASIIIGSKVSLESHENDNKKLRLFLPFFYFRINEFL